MGKMSKNAEAVEKTASSVNEEVLKKSDGENSQDKIFNLSGEADVPELKFIKEENESLRNELEDLKSMIKQFMSSQKTEAAPVTSVQSGSVMDRPYTIVHLRDVYPGLDTVARVDNKSYIFSKFGEKKLIRYEDLEKLVSSHRKWFERGILALGADCADISKDFGLEIIGELPVKTYQMLADISDSEFESFIDGLEPRQVWNVANNWVMRYRQGLHGYDNLTKLRILNKYVDGTLKGFISEISSE